MEEQEGALSQPDTIFTPKDPTPSNVQLRGDMNHWSQFALLLGLLGGGFVVGSIVSIMLVKIMLPQLNLFDMEKAMSNPANSNVFKVVQIVSTIVIFLLPAILFAQIVHKKTFVFLGFNKNMSIQQVALVVLIAWMAIYVGGLLGDLNEMIPLPKDLQKSFKLAEDAYNEQVMAIAKMNNLYDYLVALSIIALAPAIVEETFFRGTMQQFFMSWFRNPWAAIILTSILFSAIHISYYGFLTRASLGVVLGLLFYYSKNIWLNIFAHFLNNAIAVTALYEFSLQGKPMKDAMEDHFPMWLGTIGLVALVFLLILFKKASQALIEKKRFDFI